MRQRSKLPRRADARNSMKPKIPTGNQQKQQVFICFLIAIESRTSRKATRVKFAEMRANRNLDIETPFGQPH